MEILFLCGIYPQPYKEEFFINSKKGYQFAAQNLQEAIVDGFVANDANLFILTIPFLSTFPLGYKKPIVKYSPSKFNDIVPTECATFINIPFLQEIASTAERDVFKWCRSKDGKIKHIIVYSLSLNLMKIAIKAKNAFKDVQISVIVPDLPEFMGSNPIYRALGLKKSNVKGVYNNITFFDNFILLSKAMASPLGINENKYIVVEGVFNSISETSQEFEFENDTKTILYTGALSQKYGIDTLLQSFFSIPNPDYRLVICGDGDAKELIQEFVAQDNRIKYMGKVSNELILALQKKATLLVNPRTPEGEYTKFSFPSKTLEYFASGTPVLMYKLPGVPDEYFNYCYTLESLTHEALATKMMEIIELPLEERKIMGEKAKSFILEQKNAKIQVYKIIELMSKNQNLLDKNLQVKK